MRSVVTDRFRRALVVATAALAAVTIALASLAFGPAGAAGAQDDGSPAGSASTTLVPIEEQPGQGRPSIIPTPSAANGREVRDGEPGSTAQYAALALTVAGMAAIFVLVRRESRRKLAAAAQRQ